MIRQTGPYTAVFSPQSTAASPGYLTYVRERLIGNPLLEVLAQAISALPLAWVDLTAFDLELGLQNERTNPLECFSHWMSTGFSDELCRNASGVIALPLMVIIHVVQYFDHLSSSDITHSDFIHAVGPGGVQGYCVGILAALALACSKREEEVVQRASAYVRLAMVLGVYGNIDAGTPGDREYGTLVIHLEEGNQKNEILSLFALTHLAAQTDERIISVTGPQQELINIEEWAADKHVRVKKLHLRSRLHDPRKTWLLARCINSCNYLLGNDAFPSNEAIQYNIRSNISGELLACCARDPIDEVVSSVLESPCEWAAVLESVGDDLVKCGSTNHSLVWFGLGDCTPSGPFLRRNLNLHKTRPSSSFPSKFEGRSTGTPNATWNPPADAIAVVGVACRLPGADSMEELWDIVSQGQSRMQPVSKDRFDLKGSFRALQDSDLGGPRKFFGNFIDDIKSFDHDFFNVSSREAECMDPQQRLLLMSAYQAMDSSGYLRKHNRADGDRVGCFIGASYTEYVENTSAYRPSAFTATGTIRAFLSGKISYFFGWTGPSEVIDTACSASLVAIHRACQALRTGECTIALAGGVNLITGCTNFFDLSKARFLSPTGQCKPLNDSADGYCRADGVGLVVLMPLSEALARRSNILGVIPAITTSQGGLHAPSITVPDGHAQRELYETLLQRSCLTAEDVSYVEMHAPGTQAGDPVEINSVRETFATADRASPVFLGSLKSNIGHSETAAGVASVIKVLAMLRHRKIPPLSSFQKINRKIPAFSSALMRIPTRLQSWDVPRRIACVNSYGASGSNAAMLLCEWPTVDSSSGVTGLPSDRSSFPILLSAATTASLKTYASKLAYYIEQADSELRLEDLAFTLSEQRQRHKVRWTTVAEDVVDLHLQLSQISETAFFTQKTEAAPIVLAFSGQSRTYIGLDRDVYQSSPVLQYHIRTCSDVVKKLGGADFTKHLHSKDPISDPVILQCGLVAVQYACAKCWMQAGANVRGVVGHSLGELAALAVSGVLSLGDAFKVVYSRAMMINNRWGSEQGTMLAVQAKREQVEALIDEDHRIAPESSPKVEVACFNGPQSYVLVGSVQAIDRIHALLKVTADRREIRARPVAVTHGFHSHLTEPLLDGLRSLEREIVFRTPLVAIETASETPVDFGASTTGYLANHARNPVYFETAIARMKRRLGSCIWLEAGWKTPIINMTKACLQDASHADMFINTSPLGSAVDGLWRAGVECSMWSALTPEATALRHIWTPPYCFDRTPHWLQHVDRATEALRCIGVSPVNRSDRTPGLVVYDSPSESDSHAHVFRLHTETGRYPDLVRGHAVRGKPMCPVSVYLEAAVEGLDLLGDLALDAALIFEDIHCHRPLGWATNMDVGLELTRLDEVPFLWQFGVRSSANQQYCEGRLSLVRPDTLHEREAFEQLLTGRISALDREVRLDKLTRNTAYSLFSRVVEYSEVMRGIESITMGVSSAAAVVRHASDEQGFRERFDAIALDKFIQVVGFLINCTTANKRDEVFIASSIGKIALLPNSFHGDRVWTVYAACTTSEGGGTGTGSIFVLNDSGRLELYGTNIQFKRVSVSALDRVLGNLCGITTSKNSESIETAPNELDDATSLARFDPAMDFSRHTKEPARDQTSSSKVLGTLRSMVSRLVGRPASDIGIDEELDAFGLDSLSAIDLANDLKSELNIDVALDELPSCTILSLISRTHSTTTLSQYPKTAPGSSDGSRDRQHSDDEECRTETSEIAGEHMRGQFSVSSDRRHRVETTVYKTIDGVDVLADLYIPVTHPKKRMPIALMIHGGGHMTLSRKAVRPMQTRYLLENGIFPVSIDYRLCPQVNLLEGAMVDVRDACAWVQNDLPEAVRASSGIELDPTRYVVVGWSTGGTLAMTTAWTTIEAGIAPPKAILSFYCPVLYDPDDYVKMGQALPDRAMSFGEIRQKLEHVQPTNHAINSTDTTKLGWIKRGDPRSELVLALVKERNGMSLLFHGVPQDEHLIETDRKLAAACSPLEKLRSGHYSVPTFVVFGDADEVAPFETAQLFSETLEDKGVKGQLLRVVAGKHIFDLGIAPGTPEWTASIAPAYAFLFSELGQ